MTKKIINIIASVIQVSLLVFSVVMHYLSTRKMGVMRSLTYKNDVWSTMGLKNYLIIGLIVITILFIILAFINKKYGKRFRSSITFLCLSIICTVFTIYFNDTLLRAYYVLVIGAVSILTIQVLKINFIYKKV